MSECLICKKHYTQGGFCMSNKVNCLLFEEEPKGKMIRTTFKMRLEEDAETPIIKYNSKIRYTDSNKTYECTVIKINYIDMGKHVVSVDVDYHENEMPKCEKRKIFKVIS